MGEHSEKEILKPYTHLKKVSVQAEPDQRHEMKPIHGPYVNSFIIVLHVEKKVNYNRE